MQTLPRKLVTMVSDGMQRELSELAESDERTLSYLVRQAIKEYLAKKAEDVSSAKSVQRANEIQYQINCQWCGGLPPGLPPQVYDDREECTCEAEE